MSTHDEPLITPKEPMQWAEWFKDNSPTIAFTVGNLLLAAAEFRVYDFVFTSTGEIWKGLFAVLASFVPFLLWEILVQHAKATGWMRFLAWAGMVISFLLGTAIGIADFVLVNGETPNTGVLLSLLAASLSLHAVMLLAYFYSHPEIRAKRLKAEAIARQDLARSNAATAESILTSARSRLLLEREIAGEFGREELRKVIAELEGRRYMPPEKSTPAMLTTRTPEPATPAPGWPTPNRYGSESEPLPPFDPPGGLK